MKLYLKAKHYWLTFINFYKICHKMTFVEKVKAGIPYTINTRKHINWNSIIKESKWD